MSFAIFEPFVFVSVGCDEGFSSQRMLIGSLGLEMEIRDGQGFNLLLTVSGDTIREGAGYQILATIDGVYIHDGQNRIVRNVADNHIREGAGAKILYTVRGDGIFEGSGSKILFVMKGADLFDPSGFKPVLTATERLTPVQIAAVLYALEHIGFTVDSINRPPEQLP